MFAGHKLRRAGFDPLQFEYTGNTYDPAKSSQYTFTNVDIGTPHADRMVVASVSLRGGLTVINNIKINGVNGTLITRQSSLSNVGISFDKVATGTTCTIQVNLSNSNPTGCSLSMYVFRTAASTALDSGTQVGSTSQIVTNIQCSVGGVVITAGNKTTATLMTGSWNGIDSNVEDYSAIDESVARYASHILTTEANTTRDFTFTNMETAAVVSFDGI